MDDHDDDGGPPPPPPPILPPINHQSAWAIVSHAAVIFYSHPIAFLVISFALCSLRFTVEDQYDPIANKGDFYSHHSYFDTDFKTFSESISRSTNISHVRFGELQSAMNMKYADYLFRSRVAWYSQILCESEVFYAWFRVFVFIQVTNHFYGNQLSLIRFIITGLWIGYVRVLWISLMNLWLRSNILKIILYNSGEFENFYTYLVIVTRGLFIPFPFINRAPWVTVPEWKTAPFIVLLLCIDVTLGLMCSVGSSVMLVDWDIMFIFGIMEETFRLSVVLLTPAVEIRAMEAIICGAIGRGMLWSILGNFCSLAVQCVMEVFFLVAWVVYFLSARNLVGNPQLEGFLEDL